MSEVKVNKISPRTNCGTVTVGDSGDSVSVTAGVPVTVNGDLKSNALKATDGGSIISQSGTTVTIGASGDTVSLASGASQSGFGRAGSVDWQTSIKTSDFTAVSGEGYFVNTTSGAVTVTLPSSPSAGAIVAVKDYANTADTNKITFNRNSSNIDGGTVNPTIANEGGSIVLVYADATKGWLVVESAQKSDLGFATYITATGGNTINTVGDYKVHIFTGPGTFTVCSVGNSCGSNTVTATVVAGGAGGGSRHGGGGGAGGMTVGQNIPVTATGFPITVGGGGAGAPGPSSRSSAGSNSTGLSFTGVGGGQAGSQGPSPSGQPGGSGGGAAVGGVGPAGPNPGGSATQPGQSQPPVSVFNAGNAGGAGGQNPGPDDGGGGGGGATAAGTPSSPSSPNFSDGGAGKDVTPFVNGAPGYPNSATYAGGGGGGANNNPEGGTGGTGGGGNGGPSGSCGVAGTTNTGGGGGASGTGPKAGATGGSGIVIIEYKFQ
jgi:hypothetical protein